MQSKKHQNWSKNHFFSPILRKMFQMNRRKKKLCQGISATRLRPLQDWILLGYRVSLVSISESGLKKILIEGNLKWKFRLTKKFIKLILHTFQNIAHLMRQKKNWPLLRYEIRDGRGPRGGSALHVINWETAKFYI